MKKAISLILVLALCLGLCACGEKNTEPEVYTPSEIELCAEHAVESLKNVLKNPNSLAINKLHAVAADEGYVYSIDYSAENGFGGTNRKTLYIHVKKIDNGFSIITYGAASFTDDTNQKYTAQVFNKFQGDGYYNFDTQTLRIAK